MKKPSAARQRTLDLQDRALRFSNNVNQCCPISFTRVPCSIVWGQLVRAVDGVSSNLIEADDASSDADFLNKMRIALREAKESRAELAKIRMGPLDNHELTCERALENEAGELAAIYATIIRNMEGRLSMERALDDRKRKKRT